MSERMKIDARGAYCPGPLMELIAGLKLINISDEIEVLSSDKGSAKDIPEWVNKVRHETGRHHPARWLLEHCRAQSEMTTDTFRIVSSMNYNKIEP